jgi:hypothetical protein
MQARDCAVLACCRRFSWVAAAKMMRMVYITGEASWGMRGGGVGGGGVNVARWRETRGLMLARAAGRAESTAASRAGSCLLPSLALGGA